MRHDLTGRTVVITGAAGGLGTEVARRLRAKGAYLALLDIDGDKAEALATSLGGPRVARGWAADVRDLPAMVQAMTEVRDHFGHLDHVIAGAGILGQVSTLATGDADDWDRVVDINLSGVWRTFRAALPHVTEQRGHLVALSSVIAFIHPPLLSSYAASKAGVLAMCDSLRIELRETGVGVTSIHPAIFRTALIEGGLSSPAGAALVQDFTGMWETVTVEEVAAGVVRALERRPKRVITPRKLSGAPYIPGVLQGLLERTVLRPSAVRRAIELGSVVTAPDDRPDRASRTATWIDPHLVPTVKWTPA